jgi:hypothetical protein
MIMVMIVKETDFELGVYLWRIRDVKEKIINHQIPALDAF